MAAKAHHLYPVGITHSQLANFLLGFPYMVPMVTFDFKIFTGFSPGFILSKHISALDHHEALISLTLNPVAVQIKFSVSILSKNCRVL